MTLEHHRGSKTVLRVILLTALTIWQRNVPLSIAMSGWEEVRQPQVRVLRGCHSSPTESGQLTQSVPDQ